MKSRNKSRDSILAATRGHGGFTITELLIAVTIFSLVIAGVVAANLFGMKMLRVSQNKLIASDGARRAIGKMTDEIRNATKLYVGNVTNGIFSAVPDGLLETGNGLLINPSTNDAEFILYYLNPADNSFRRSTSTTNKTMIVARSITNTVAFTAQDCFGNALTNSSQVNRTFHVDLEFYHPQYFGVGADAFKLESSITRRLKL
jgi:prepilin-type N-terminal cleavage/methylation domain-containing protein